MTSKEMASGFRTCPSCGAALEASLADQFFCEYCGSPLGEEKQQSVLPDWLQDVPAEGENGPDDGPDWLESIGGTARSDGPGSTRIELHPTGAARARATADRRQSGISCTLVLGILFFLAALCLLGWVLFAVVRQRAPEPASSLTASYLVAMSADRSWTQTLVRTAERRAVARGCLEHSWQDWSESGARKPLQGLTRSQQSTARSWVRKVEEGNAVVHLPPVWL